MSHDPAYWPATAKRYATELKTLRDAIRALHREGVDSSRGMLVGDGECRECERSWPCATIRALGNGPAESPQEPLTA